MTDYLTPRRRHSSLFQRMENQIHKISKKLSAAKQHRQSHSHQKPSPSDFKHHQRQPTSGLPARKQNYFEQSQAEETVRRGEQNFNSKEITRKLSHFREASSINRTIGRGPARRLRFGPTPAKENQQFIDCGDQVQKLIQQNNQLSSQLIKMQHVCEEQAFKIGYMRAQNRQKGLHMQEIKQAFGRQQLYMQKLLQGYKIKVNKYKQMYRESVQLSIKDVV